MFTFDNNSLQPIIQHVLEDIDAQVSGVHSVEHNTDGTHSAITAVSVATTGDATIGGNIECENLAVNGFVTTDLDFGTSALSIAIGDTTISNETRSENHDYPTGQSTGGATTRMVRVNQVFTASADDTFDIGYVGDTNRRFRAAYFSKYVNAPTVHGSTAVYAGFARIGSGNGTPEAAVTGNVGDLFLRRDGGAGTTLYVKESGTGSSGWVAK